MDAGGKEGVSAGVWGSQLGCVGYGVSKAPISGLVRMLVHIGLFNDYQCSCRYFIYMLHGDED